MMRIAFLAGLAWLVLTDPAIAAEPLRADAREPGWKSAAFALGDDATLVLDGLADAEGRAAAGALVLSRLQVIADDAELRVNGGAPTALAPRLERTHLSGRLEGDPDSRATLIIGARGDVRGLVRSSGRVLALTEASGGGLVLAEVATDRSPREFSCGNEGDLVPPPLPPRPGAGAAIPGVPPGGFAARIAIETDFEYFALFGNTEDAIAYTADLIAFSSTVYQAEADTELGISSLSLWTDSNDPWDQNDTLCTLFQFGRYWNDNNGNIDRTIAHFISGRNINGGVAWVGVLCRDGFDANQSSCPGLPSGPGSRIGGDYGVSMGLDGNFDIASPSSVWDIVVVSHEIGHNFDSPHTHCYAGLGGNAEPVDRCFTGQSGPNCASGAASLPGPSGVGAGTIMSYCHFRSGGLSNIGLTLGLDHPYGVEPERVPNRMLAHLINQEASFPGCLTTPLGGGVEVIFDNSFEAPIIR